MPPSLPPLDRALTLLFGSRLRRALAWATVAVLGGGAAAAHATFVLVGTPPAPATRVALNAAYVLAAALAYGLAARSWWTRLTDPLRALWTPSLVVLGTAVATMTLPALVGQGEGLASASAGLARNLPTVLTSTALLVLETAAAIVVLLSLRPLVLARRGPHSLRNWRLLLGAVGAYGLVLLGRTPVAASGVAQGVVGFLAVVAFLGSAFRLAWIAPLSFRHKLATMALSAALVTTLGLLFAFRADNAHEVMLVDRSGLTAGYVPYASLTGYALGEMNWLVFSFGLLYATTTLLSLLFHLPTTDAYTQRTGELRAFQTLAELSGQILDRAELAATIARAPVTAGIAQSAWLALVDVRRGSLRPVVVTAEGFTPERAGALVDAAALTADVADSGVPLLLGNAAADHRVRARPGDGVGSLLVLPLVAGGQTHGALFAARPFTEGFEDDDVGALATFAGQAALALQTSDLLVETLEKERLARELALAREVQQRLLPQHLPTLEGVELAAMEHAPNEVCGDYYDVAVYDEGCLGVLVADVSGKGAAAAFYMAELKGVFQATARASPSPGAFLARANTALMPSLGRRSFISAVYGVLDPAAGRLTLARAGHCPVAMVRADGALWWLRGDGLGLGLDDGPLFRHALTEQAVDLEPGDVFVLYTDGLVEARNGEGEEYGYDRLGEAVARHRRLGADALLEALLADQRAFAGDTPMDDDVTILVLRWTGRGLDVASRSDTAAAPAAREEGAARPESSPRPASPAATPALAPSHPAQEPAPPDGAPAGAPAVPYITRPVFGRAATVVARGVSSEPSREPRPYP